jgi:ribosome-associated toxin RatA of RatAB toxin-antitoxin module
MPTVESQVSVAAPVERVYEIARDIERFPEFMADVVEVEILEQTPERQVSRWVGLIKELNRKINWTEEDFWDEESRSCEFRMLEGDYTSYGGSWKFEPEGDGCLVTLVVEFEYQVPLVGALIKNLLKRKMQENCDSMLAALKAEAEKG